jgi:hypothetical protein
MEAPRESTLQGGKKAGGGVKRGLMPTRQHGEREEGWMDGGRRVKMHGKERR